jgi:hypothetical protein
MYQNQVMYHVAVQRNFSAPCFLPSLSYVHLFLGRYTGRVSVMQVKNIAHGPQSVYSKYHATSGRALLARSSLTLDYVPSRQGHTCQFSDR